MDDEEPSIVFFLWIVYIIRRNIFEYLNHTPTNSFSQKLSS